jgi:hypothetical protein
MPATVAIVAAARVGAGSAAVLPAGDGGALASIGGRSGGGATAA